MKGMIIFLAALSLSSAAVFPRELPVCPDPENGTEAVLFPNPEDCSTFYECFYLDPILLNCPNGLWFNPKLGVCDFPVNVAPGGCKPPVITSTSQAPPTTEELDTTTEVATTQEPGTTNVPTTEKPLKI